MPIRRVAHRNFDLRQLGDGEWVVGVDEAGRGALAGPVCAGAVIVHRSFYDCPWCRRVGGRVDDSKKLPPDERGELFQAIAAFAAEGGLWFAAGWGSVEEIAVYNILGATRLAMQRAMEAAVAALAGRMRLPSTCDEAGGLFGMDPVPCACVLVDGKPLRPFPYVHTSIIQGDGRSLAIGLASIVAKVSRDRHMVELDGADPRYGYAHHKGYATDRHCDAIREHGASALHRALFLRKILSGEALVDEQVEIELT